MKKEQKRRSIVKALTYRLGATMATFLITFTFTGNLKLATTIGCLDALVKFILFYINERLWMRTTWGYPSNHPSTSSHYDTQEAFSKLK